MNKVTHMDHVQMMVGNLEDAVAFYQKHFDFQIRQMGNRMGDRWTILKAGDSPVCLALVEDTEGVKEKVSGARLFHYGLVVDDFEGTYWNLHQEGVRLDPPNGYIEYEGSRSFYFFDLNGHKVEVSEHVCGGL
ncbi:VOC family protein [Deinococcus arcticus]|uniref:VOC domain-containing protein n=1 Tax=Deinococcus arcticus TaxID=2136176 RepID=A0A2T3W455_9DEIO|nr:VOC family protein [Deinococcus arcticus]PTA66543.1 hypothetical protein C8263_17295 [Deinococcus arcticus]